MPFDPQYTSPALLNEPRMVAVDLYRHLAWKARLRCFWARLTRKQGHLQQLCAPQQDRPVHGTGNDPVYEQKSGHSREGAYVGMRTIAIDTICGSEERAEDFDNLFRPLAHHTRDRWLSIAEARLRGTHMPPVQLIEMGGRYFVRDGHHRISVARALGESFVDAEVVRWQMR